MKKIFSKKTLALILLIPSLLATCYLLFAVPLAHAQDVQLLPNASPKDVQVETAPYKGQDYQIQTALSPIIIGALLGNTLGTITNTVFEMTSENLMKWIGDVIHFGIINAYTLLAGEDAWSDWESGGSIGGYDIYAPQRRGVLGILGYLTGDLLRQSPPNLQTGEFIKHELANNLVSQPAYAKTGTSHFKSVVTVWELTRNLAYIFMVVILIAMGFMVMMRRQIDPRTTMTVTAALPKIAISLILIAFSYPIAGILIDLGRLLKGLIDSTFGSLIPLRPVEPFGLIVHSFGRYFLNIYLGGTNISGMLIALGLQIITIIVVFMLFFTLVTRFAGLFMQFIFAPFVFAWGALPGQEDTTSRWFKSFAVNVLCFPVIYFLVNLSLYIANITITEPMSLPSDLGWGTWFAVGATNVGGLVAFGLLMAATKVPAALEDAFAVTAPAAVAKAGVEPGKILGRVPVVGKLFK